MRNIEKSKRDICFANIACCFSMFLLADKGKRSLQIFHSLIQQGSSSSYVESLLDECVEDVGKEKDLYAKLARIKSKNKNILELKKIISSTHETVTNMYKMEESYGYNYKEYDEKMDNYLEDITDAQTKIDSKKEER
ncbi:MAG: hypothetical protein V8R84_07255 [Eubacterium sp.]